MYILCISDKIVQVRDLVFCEGSSLRILGFIENRVSTPYDHGCKLGNMWVVPLISHLPELDLIWTFTQPLFCQVLTSCIFMYTK